MTRNNPGRRGSARGGVAKENTGPGEYIAGRNAVRELLEAEPGRILKVLFAKGVQSSSVSDMRALARRQDVPTQDVPTVRLERIVAGVNHQGIVAQVTELPYATVHDVLSACAPMRDDVISRKPVVLLLDRIQDPFNFGGIIRSAVAAGVCGIIVPDRESAPLNAAAVKASAGTAMRIAIARAPNLVRVIEDMKERGYWIGATSGAAEQSIWEEDWDRPLGLVIGNEEKGVRPAVLKACDFQVRIPIEGSVESLNASVSAGIVLFEIARTRAGSHAEAPASATP